MHLASLVDMIESGYDTRKILGPLEDALTGSEFADLARRGASALGGAPVVVYAGENHRFLPVALFSAALAGVPFVPVNYRLEDTQLNDLIGQQENALVLADAETAPRIQSSNVQVYDAWLESIKTVEADPAREIPEDDNEVAIILYTSGTTAAPKQALLRHRHLMAYLLGTVEFFGADESEAVLISVPPYHIAGMANMLSNLFTGRRLVYLQAFSPQAWLDTVNTEGISHTMVVPTMLARIVAHLDGKTDVVPSLRTISYGGAKVAERVLREALIAFPSTGFVNAYGLTETASTLAVLGPDEHREAITSEDPVKQRRLRSVGQPLPTVEISLRDDDDNEVAPGEVGMLFVRGDQISGEYSTGSLLADDGWFCTRDRAWQDEEGYLFIEGRADDTIIRGGENIAPAEIEAVLLSHAGVADACVFGAADEEWGERVIAAVVPTANTTLDTEELRSLVRSTLRGSKTPDQILVRDELPHSETGKLLRRIVAADYAASVSSE